MKNSFDKNGIQRFPLRRIQIDDLDKLAGLPIEKEDQALVEKVAKKISGKHQAVVLPKNEGPNDKYWIIHKRFAELREVHGKPFERFVGDWLDFLLTGSLQEKFTNQCFEEALKQERRKKIDPLSPEGAMNKNLPSPVGIEILIGGEPVTRSYHYLKRKRLLSLLFLDSEKYSDFVKLMKQIEIVCESEGVVEILKGLDRAARRKAVEEILDRLKFQINPKDVKSAWVLLEFDLFEDLGWLYDKIRNLSLLRPSFYEDFDHAYRYAKKLLKLMISEFELTFPPEKEKKGAILDYLRDTLEVYTYHHFVLKFYQQTIMPISRHEIEKEQMGFLSRIDGLRAENRQVRDELSRVTLERDQALAQSRTAKQETEQFREKLGKLDPLELTKQSRAMEAKLKDPAFVNWTPKIKS
ncbi:hypothetical protein HYY75_03055 [bacterium]|nr:hypothetical protein [bacterium]